MRNNEPLKSVSADDNNLGGWNYMLEINPEDNVTVHVNGHLTQNIWGQDLVIKAIPGDGFLLSFHERALADGGQRIAAIKHFRQRLKPHVGLREAKEHVDLYVKTQEAKAKTEPRERRMVCSKCGACACHDCFKGRCRHCGSDRQPKAYHDFELPE